MRKSSGKNEQRLKDHDRIHRSSAHHDSHKKEDAAHDAFDRMMAQARSYIYIVVGMMNDVKSP
jgi:hypothetical protein